MTAAFCYWLGIYYLLFSWSYHRKITVMTFGKYPYSISEIYFFININNCLAPISYFQIMEVGPKYLSYHFNCSNIHQGKQKVA